MPSCFISHTWYEGEHYFAVHLSEALKKRGIEVWIDQDKISPGSHIKEIIRKGIDHDSDVFLFVMSPQALKSDMCIYELKLALHQMEENGKPIIPILFKECKIPKFLKNICYADFRNATYFEAAIQRLIDGIYNTIRVRQLCLGLKHPDPEKRIEISKILGELKDPLSFGPLKNRLLSEEFDPTVRYWLALTIGDMGGKKALDILSQALEESDLHARLGVIKALTKVLEFPEEEIQEQGMRTLFEAIDSDNPNKRFCAIKVLIWLKWKNDAIESKLSKLIYDPDDNVRSTVKGYYKSKGRVL